MYIVVVIAYFVSDSGSGVVVITNLMYVMNEYTGVPCGHGFTSDLKINWIAGQASPSESTGCRNVAIEPIPKQRHM